MPKETCCGCLEYKDIAFVDEYSTVLCKDCYEDLKNEEEREKKKIMGK